MPMKEKVPEYLLKPYRVVHTSGHVCGGFDDKKSADEDAAGRNTRAAVLGIKARYKAVEK